MAGRKPTTLGLLRMYVHHLRGHDVRDWIWTDTNERDVWCQTCEPRSPKGPRPFRITYERVAHWEGAHDSGSGISGGRRGLDSIADLLGEVHQAVDYRERPFSAGGRGGVVPRVGRRVLAGRSRAAVNHQSITGPERGPPESVRGAENRCGCWMGPAGLEPATYRL